MRTSERAAVDDAVAVLSRHAHNPSAILALNEGTQRFTVPGLDGVIAYRPAGRRYLVQFGGPFANPGDAGALLDAFLAHARQERRRVVAAQVCAEDLPLYAARRFDGTQFGSSYAVPLEDFGLAGKRFMSLRNKVSRARRAGVEIAEVGVDLSPTGALDGQLDALTARWLRDKGGHAKELTFLVGERGGPAAHLRRLFVARRGDQVLGYLSLSPVFGRHAGWLHDLSRRDPEGPPGVAELLTVTAIERFRAEGAAWLHFGFTPCAGLDPAHEAPGARSGLARGVVRLVAERCPWLYPTADQLAYKLKWAPQLVQPEYVTFQGGVRPGAVWALLRVTGAV